MFSFWAISALLSKTCLSTTALHVMVHSSPPHYYTHTKCRDSSVHNAGIK